MRMAQNIADASMTLLDGFMNNILTWCFYIEDTPGLKFPNTDSLETYVKAFGISLITLKFVMKLFNTYIIQTDGDPSNNPLNMIVNYVKAIFIASTFSMFYELMYKIVKSFSLEVNSRLNLDVGLGTLYVLFTGIAGVNPIIGILEVIYIIGIFVLIYQFLKRGVQLFLIRVGMPIACVGLLDSNGGVFIATLQILFQNALTVIVQLALFKLSIIVMAGTVEGGLLNPLFGMGILLASFSIPNFLQRFTIASGTGGSLNNIYHAGRMVSSAKGYVSKSISTASKVVK